MLQFEIIEVPLIEWLRLVPFFLDMGIIFPLLKNSMMLFKLVVLHRIGNE